MAACKQKFEAVPAEQWQNGEKMEKNFGIRQSKKKEKDKMTGHKKKSFGPGIGSFLCQLPFGASATQLNVKNQNNVGEL